MLKSLIVISFLLNLTYANFFITPDNFLLQIKRTTFSIGNFVVTSTEPSYGPDQCKEDLLKTMELSKAEAQLANQIDETVAAIMDSAAHYYIELPTRKICRAIISFIRAESDFNPHLTDNHNRFTGGLSYGLMGVSPDGHQDELDLFKAKADSSRVLDWKTRQPLDVNSLQLEDLKRPWVNIHIASWFLSNMARSGSPDLKDWSNDKRGIMSPSVLNAFKSWVGEKNLAEKVMEKVLEGLTNLEGFGVTEDDLEKLKVLGKVIQFKKDTRK